MRLEELFINLREWPHFVYLIKYYFIEIPGMAGFAPEWVCVSGRAGRGGLQRTLGVGTQAGHRVSGSAREPTWSIITPAVLNSVPTPRRDSLFSRNFLMGLVNI